MAARFLSIVNTRPPSNPNIQEITPPRLSTPQNHGPKWLFEKSETGADFAIVHRVMAVAR
jgi:hypothetical protein